MRTHETIKRQRCGRAISGGYTLIELVVVVALIAIVTAIGAPMYLSFARAQETDGAARELVAALNQARQLAITRGTSFSVETQTNPNNRMRFCSGTTVPCPGGSVWTGGETDGAGWRRLGNPARIVLGPNIMFSSLGAATGSGTLRVQNSSATGCLDVVVNPSGSARIRAPGACP
jgi:prepilin-type N-terminal cleavage/methylation domain-containing protein